MNLIIRKYRITDAFLIKVWIYAAAFFLSSAVFAQSNVNPSSMATGPVSQQVLKQLKEGLDPSSQDISSLSRSIGTDGGIASASHAGNSTAVAAYETSRANIQKAREAYSRAEGVCNTKPGGCSFKERDDLRRAGIMIRRQRTQTEVLGKGASSFRTGFVAVTDAVIGGAVGTLTRGGVVGTLVGAGAGVATKNFGPGIADTLGINAIHEYEISETPASPANSPEMNHKLDVLDYQNDLESNSIRQKLINGEI